MTIRFDSRLWGGFGVRVVGDLVGRGTPENHFAEPSAPQRKSQPRSFPVPESVGDDESCALLLTRRAMLGLLGPECRGASLATPSRTILERQSCTRPLIAVVVR
jgi:hypothetical protein